MGTTDNFLNSFGSPEVLPEVESPGALDAFVNDFGGTTESHWFYNHTEELRFDRPTWTWYRVDPELGNLIPLYGVTNTVKRADNPAALIPWAAKVCIEKLLRTIPVYTSPLGTFVPEMTLADFTKLAMEAKSAHKDILETSGDIGHDAHECLEKSIKKALLTPEKKLLELTDLPEDVRAVSCARSAKGWADLHNVRWVSTETKVYSKEFQYAGTMDALALVDACYNLACCPVPFKDVLSVIDFKSSNRLRISYVFQVAGYKKARIEEYGGQIPDCWILRLGKETEEFEPWHLLAEDFEDDFAGFLACLELLQIVDKVEERISNQKHRITAVKKEQRAEAKALEKAAEKLRKATEKAEQKLKRAEEKAKVKAEIKAERQKLREFTERALEYLPTPIPTEEN